MCSSTLVKRSVHTPTRINISLDIYVAHRYATTVYIYARLCMYYKIYASLRRTRFGAALSISASRNLRQQNLPAVARTGGRCAARMGNPSTLSLSLYPRAPISIMKLHRIKQTSGRHDELARWISHVLFVRTYR